MSRTINESIQTLDTSLDTIKEKLSEHLTEGGGGMPEQLKVSEIPGYLDQIETGGGSGELRYIDWVESKGQRIDPIGNIVYVHDQIFNGDSGSSTYKIKFKADCFMWYDRNNISTNNPNYYEVSAGAEIELTWKDYQYTAIVFAPYIEDYVPPDETIPDILVLGVSHYLS